MALGSSSKKKLEPTECGTWIGAICQISPKLMLWALGHAAKHGR